jgi:hypothetical protein
LALSICENPVFTRKLDGLCLSRPVIQTAKLNGLNPEAYLRDNIAKIADAHPINRIDELMPLSR